MQIMLNLAKQRNPTFVQSFDRNQQAVQGKILFKFKFRNMVIKEIYSHLTRNLKG